MGVLRFVVEATGVEYPVPEGALEELLLPDSMQTVELLGNRVLLVSPVDATTQRVFGPVTWRLSWPPLHPDLCGGTDTPGLKSLLLGWKHADTLLRLEGVDLLDLTDEPLRRVVTGTDAQRRFVGARGWWAEGAVVRIDGAVAGGHTVDADRGWVTFDAAVAAGATVTVSVARRPRVRVLRASPQPQNGVDPLRYAPSADFLEMTP